MATRLLEDGAPRRTRTADHLFTKQVLYQLSYWGRVRCLDEPTPGRKRPRRARTYRDCPRSRIGSRLAAPPVRAARRRRRSGPPCLRASPLRPRPKCPGCRPAAQSTTGNVGRSICRRQRMVLASGRRAFRPLGRCRLRAKHFARRCTEAARSLDTGGPVPGLSRRWAGPVPGAQRSSGVPETTPLCGPSCGASADSNLPSLRRADASTAASV